MTLKIKISLTLPLHPPLFIFCVPRRQSTLLAVALFVFLSAIEIIKVKI